MNSNLNERSTDPENSPEEKHIWRRISHQLNFYRVHTLFFLFTPLFFSVIFYLCNGRYKISYVDSLFNCVSAMTVCGLATVDLSSLTGFQQALLFFQMCIGNQIMVSWVMVLIRKYFFAQKFEHIFQNTVAAQAAEVVAEAGKAHKPWPHRIVAFFSEKHVSLVGEGRRHVKENERRLRTDMIRRVNDAPILVDPSGLVSDESSRAVQDFDHQASERVSPQDTGPSHLDATANSSRSAVLSRSPSPIPSLKGRSSHQLDSEVDANLSRRLPRTHTIEFAPTPEYSERSSLWEENNDPISFELRSIRSRRGSTLQTHSLRTQQTHHSLHDLSSKNRDFGGFPTPWTILSRLFPKGISQKLARTVTIPAAVPITPSNWNVRPGTKPVSYISFEAVVGRNSTFRMLTRGQMEEIGGIEYRALNALVWIIPIYHLFVQLISFTIIAPYISQPKWQHIFRDEQLRRLNSVWFSAFQVVSAYTNTGMSLVDQSMIPFQDAKVMIVVMIFLILAGNTSFPIFLRFGIWCSTKVIRKNSRLDETLHFLLDHPRRCFIYLFPSHQTWFLFTIVLGLTLIDWFFFLILDINNPPISEIPLNNRVLDGLMQAVAVRAAGFVIVPLAAVAPSVKVLYVITMYISVYPIAMSVRSTNVYEEQSLGIFNEDDDQDEEQKFEASGPRLTVWSRYLAMHARRQLAFDMWWLAISLFLICIIEKNDIENPANFSWFTIFNIIFELVSAYGTVGLSLGIPNQNYSFVGAMHPLSKLVICAVMLRGRHRGLPVAIDRAIMLPSQVEKAEDPRLGQATSEQTGRPLRRSGTVRSHRTSGTSNLLHRRSRIAENDLELLPRKDNIPSDGRHIESEP